jgi:hypothetical protein
LIGRRGGSTLLYSAYLLGTRAYNMQYARERARGIYRTIDLPVPKMAGGHE